MIILVSISRPGRLALSLVSVVRVLSAGKLSSCREGGQISGVRTCLLEEVVFHSPEVLGSRGESCVVPYGCLETPRARHPGAGVGWKGLVKFTQSISRLSDLLFGFVSLILIKCDMFSFKICCDGQNSQVLRMLLCR